LPLLLGSKITIYLFFISTLFFIKYISLKKDVFDGESEIKTKVFNKIGGRCFGVLGLLELIVGLFLPSWSSVGIGGKYLLILSALPKDLHTTYFLIELITVLIMIVFLIIVQNKSPIISITYIVLMATYGMIYGCNLLFGGVRFLPFLILAKDHESEKTLTQVSEYWFHFVYLIAFILIVSIGIWKNKENYNIVMNRVKPKEK
jgi:hypothetical protein